MHHKIDQNSEEWLTLRAGKVTGSSIAKVMANYGKAFGEPAKNLAVNIAIERATGNPIQNGYTNEHMQRGHEQEPLARMAYEHETFAEVEDGGFYDNGKTGCSPDGLVSDLGLIEIKSVLPHVHHKRIKSQRHDPAYHWQLLFNLRESGRDWIDFVSYSQDYTPSKKLFVCTLRKSDFGEDLEKIETRLAEFEEKIDEAAQYV